MRTHGQSGYSSFGKKTYNGGLLCKSCADRRNLISLVGVVVLLFIAVPVVATFLVPESASVRKNAQPVNYVR